ncbi:MAG: hypothetical protein ACE15C_00950 [Phycisphaerae bacterium]
MAKASMTDEQLRRAIRGLSVNGKVPCKALLDLAARASVSPGRIGRLCDEMGIRIRGCQLGCFK